MSELTTFTARIFGRVQGVNFRFFVERHARALGLNGYVRNIRGGREVEVFAEGEKEKLGELLEHLHAGPSRAVVDRVDIEWLPYKGMFKDFEVRF